jgi:hypothetical protein
VELKADYEARLAAQAALKAQRPPLVVSHPPGAPPS